MAGSESGVELEYIVKKKATILLHGGYQYCVKTRNKNGSVLWECTQRKKSKCTGSILIHVSKTSTDLRIIINVRNCSNHNIK